MSTTMIATKPTLSGLSALRPGDRVKSYRANQFAGFLTVKANNGRIITAQSFLVPRYFHASDGSEVGGKGGKIVCVSD